MKGPGYLHFAPQTCHGRFDQILLVFGRELDTIRNAVELFDGHYTSLVEAICDTDWMDSSVEERLTLLEKGTGKDLINSVERWCPDVAGGDVPTTPVVPSPISSSWLLESCTRSFAI